MNFVSGQKENETYGECFDRFVRPPFEECPGKSSRIYCADSVNCEEKDLFRD